MFQHNGRMLPSDLWPKSKIQLHREIFDQYLSSRSSQDWLSALLGSNTSTPPSPPPLSKSNLMINSPVGLQDPLRLPLFPYNIIPLNSRPRRVYSDQST